MVKKDQNSNKQEKQTFLFNQNRRQTRSQTKIENNKLNLDIDTMLENQQVKENQTKNQKITQKKNDNQNKICKIKNIQVKLDKKSEKADQKIKKEELNDHIQPQQKRQNKKQNLQEKSIIEEQKQQEKDLTIEESKSQNIEIEFKLKNKQKNKKTIKNQIQIDDVDPEEEIQIIFKSTQQKDKNSHQKHNQLQLDYFATIYKELMKEQQDYEKNAQGNQHNEDQKYPSLETFIISTAMGQIRGYFRVTTEMNNNMKEEGLKSMLYYYINLAYQTIVNQQNHQGDQDPYFIDIFDKIKNELEIKSLPRFMHILTFFIWEKIYKQINLEDICLVGQGQPALDLLGEILVQKIKQLIINERTFLLYLIENQSRIFQQQQYQDNPLPQEDLYIICDEKIYTTRAF
ncbi:hypothetical protein PPERSA_08086 [Pseudocohnilembus persalinus]|uniref:Uncharacterized protein n=1 Tax=Pseudocohnilembus persalinus TaxID=266149 RepID=A0A0V0R2P8_PSEPJ|nr:hypothetical protein PPERSA_08086 [Pseudocohnilembus persalinus]|eukprot:KRX08775.1 hypothetical protein PPERSA_08086 [Pseudocohnilembus persalinus]